MKTVLVILHEGFEELEAVAPIDLLRRAGAAVTIATITPQLQVSGRNRIAIMAECRLDEQADKDFDLVLLPGGPGVALLRKDRTTLEVVRRQAARGGGLAAICAAPIVLREAGVLPKRYTAHGSTLSELPELNSAEKVVVDGRTITSRGAGTAVEFGLACVDMLFDNATAGQIAHNIHFESMENK